MSFHLGRSITFILFFYILSQLAGAKEYDGSADTSDLAIARERGPLHNLYCVGAISSLFFQNLPPLPAGIGPWDNTTQLCGIDSSYAPTVGCECFDQAEINCHQQWAHPVLWTEEFIELCKGSCLCRTRQLFLPSNERTFQVGGSRLWSPQGAGAREAAERARTAGLDSGTVTRRRSGTRQGSYSGTTQNQCISGVRKCFGSSSAAGVGAALDWLSP